jgi:hypothetical protein
MGETALSDSMNKSDQPAIAADDDGNVHVVWEERLFDEEAGTFRYEIHYLKGVSETLGMSWDISPTLLPTELDSAKQPDIAVMNGTVHVAFARRVSDDQQYAYYMSYSPDSDWSVAQDVTHEPVSVNSNVPFVLVPSLTLCKDAVHIYYHGALVANGKETILDSKSVDGWEHADLVDLWDARAIRPSALCLGGRMHLVYEKVLRPNREHQVYYLSGNRYATYFPALNRQ